MPFGRSIYAAFLACGLIATSAIAAIGQHSPLADVAELCTKKFSGFPAAVDAFRDRGWTDQDSTVANEDVLDMMMLSMFYGTEQDWTPTKDEFIERFKLRRQNALNTLGFSASHRIILKRSDQQHISSLILALDKRGANTHIIICNVASSTEAEADWLRALVEDGKLHKEFDAFDPKTANLSFASPIGMRLTSASKESRNSSLLIFSRERVAPMLPRPMRYDLFFSVATGHFGDD